MLLRRSQLFLKNGGNRPTVLKGRSWFLLCISSAWRNQGRKERAGNHRMVYKEKKSILLIPAANIYWVPMFLCGSRRMNKKCSVFRKNDMLLSSQIWGPLADRRKGVINEDMIPCLLGYIERRNRDLVGGNEKKKGEREESRKEVQEQRGKSTELTEEKSAALRKREKRQDCSLNSAGMVCICGKAS